MPLTPEEIDARAAAIIAELRAIRQSRGLSTYKVAAASGLKQSNVVKLETRVYPPNLITLVRYADAIGVQLCIRDKE